MGMERVSLLEMILHKNNVVSMPMRRSRRIDLNTASLLRHVPDE